MKRNKTNCILIGCALMAAFSTVSCDDAKDFGSPLKEHLVISSVTVNPTPFDALNDTICLLPNKTLQLLCNVLPSNVTNPQLKWTSSNEEVATVSDNGFISTKGVTGRAIIRIAPEIGFGPAATTPFKVIKVIESITYISALEIQGMPTKNMYEGERFTLTYKITPKSATYPTCEWTTSNPTIATINKQGEVELKSPGTVLFTIKSKDVVSAPNGNQPIEASYSLTVMKSVPIENVTVDTESTLMTLGYGQTYQLKYTLTPADATAAMLTWTSSAPTEVLVDEKGQISVIGRKAASAEITATAPNGKSSTINVSIEAGKLKYWFGNSMSPWGLSNSATYSSNGMYSTVNLGTQNATKSRGDLQLATSGKLFINPSVYKIMACKFRSNSLMNTGNGSDGAMSFELRPTGGSAATWNNNTYTVLGGTRTPGEVSVVYWDMSSKITTTGAFEVDLFNIKMADFLNSSGTTYDVYWIQTFKTVEELQEYVNTGN